MNSYDIVYWIFNFLLIIKLYVSVLFPPCITLSLSHKVFIEIVSSFKFIFPPV